MKANELKLRILTSLDEMINIYFGSNTMVDKFINSTLHIVVKQKSYMLDDILALFTDNNGDVDVDLIMEEYMDMFGDNGITIDIRDYIKNDFIKSMMPDKSLIIKTSDIRSMLNIS